MMTSYKTPQLAIAVAAVCCTASIVQAATMTYPDLVGDTVTFIAPTEESNTATLNYDAPTVVLDTLYLVPNNFGVQVVPGPGASLIDSEFKTTIMAKPGHTINTISFSEAGDFSAFNNGKVTADLPYFWTIQEVDNVGVAPVLQQGLAQFVGNGTSSGIWELDFDIDLAGTNATKVFLTFDNKLLADADDSLSSGFIKKKQTSGIRVTTSVPEPSSIALLSLASLAIVTAGRRRRRRAA